MTGFMGKDGFVWWIGVVEDRMDPKMLGRCRCRILGFHTPDKEDIKTENLPWAHPVSPITSASMNGIGFSPVGPVEGTWVFGFFKDGHSAQQPVMMGTLGGIPEKGPSDDEEEKFAGAEGKRPAEWTGDKGFLDPRDDDDTGVKLKDAPIEGQGKENGKGYFEKQEFPDGAEKDGDEHGAQLENEEEGKNFPREDYVGSDEEEGEPDTNRLARNIEEEIKKTVVEFKRNLLTDEGEEQGIRDTKIFVADCDIPEFDCGVTNESEFNKGTKKFEDATDLKLTSSSFTSLNKDWKLFSDEGTDAKDENLNAEPEGGGGGPNTNGWWNEPETPYARYGVGGKKGEDVEEREVNDADPPLTIYPYNKVYQSESGHIFEIDDTPNSERLHQYHRSGTFEEIHPNGDKVTKVVRDNYTTILRNDMLHIDGFASTTVDKGLKIFVNRDRLENEKEEAVNFDIHVGENANVNIFVEKGHINARVIEGDVNMNLEKGDMNIRQHNGDYNHFINGDYNLEIAGHKHIVVGEDSLTEIGGARDVRVDGEFDYLELTGENIEGGGEPYLEWLIAGDVKHTIEGKKEQDIKKSWSAKIKEDWQLEVDWNYNNVLKQECKFDVGWSYHVDVGNDVSMKSGWETTIESATNLHLTGKQESHLFGGLLTYVTGMMYVDIFAGIENKLTGHQNIHLNGPMANLARWGYWPEMKPTPPHEDKEGKGWRKTPNENEEPQEKGSEQNVEHEHTEKTCGKLEIDPKYDQEDSGDKEVITKLKEIPEE